MVDDSVAALLAQMRLEDEATAATAAALDNVCGDWETQQQTGGGGEEEEQDDESAIVSFIADAVVNFDDELEVLRRGGPGALREHALQEALADVSAMDGALRLQEIKLRRFCAQPGAARDAPQALLDKCLRALDDRRQQQAATQRENEYLEQQLLLARREAELTDALQRAERAELTLAGERQAHRRTLQRADAAVSEARQRTGGAGGTDTPASESTNSSTGSAAMAHSPQAPPQPPTTAANTNQSDPRQVIERIRRERLITGSSSPEGGGGPVAMLQRTLGRALEKLSQDLYSTADHFFSELVQNSDDNVYAPGVTPWLRVVLQD
eukprot:COSAG05_NODE_3902_length_1779_cov_5.636315_1_plen_324_part_10